MNESIFADRGNNVKSIIYRSIIERILLNGSFLISEISDDTGYSQTTIGKHVSKLVKDGIIHEMEKVNLHTKGRKAIRYGTTPDNSYFLGIDPRPYELEIGIIDIVGNFTMEKVYPGYTLENTYESFDTLCNIIQDYIAELPKNISSKIKAGNINVPGRVNPNNGTSATIFKFEGTETEPLAETFTQRLDLPIYIENDTRAMLYGEYVTNRSHEITTMHYVNFSWGIGLGMMVNGKLYYGKDGYAGEIGHVHTYDNNILCHCGKKGCLETEVSGRAIARRVKERILKGEASLLSPIVKSGKKLTTKDLIEAIEKEDPLCLEITADVGAKLGKSLAGVVNTLNPDLIVIGGDFSQIESYYFLEPIKLAIRQYSLKLVSKDLPIVSSNLGTEAGVRGACLIARARYYGIASTI